MGGVVPARNRLRVLVAVGVAFAAVQVLLLVPRLAPWALAIVAVGVGAAVAGQAERYPLASRRLGRATALVLAVGACLIALGVNVRRVLRERQALAGVGAAPSAPNIVVAVLDAVRAEDMGVYGGPVPNTPFFTRAAAQCLTFDHAIAPASWTLPSHASMFTGRWASELTADWAVPLGVGIPVVAEALGARGYATGAAVGNYLYTYYEFGLSRGFAHYDDYGISLSESAMRNVVGDHLARGWNAVAHDFVVPGRKPAERVRTDAMRWVDHVGHRPFFLFLNLYDAHDPYAPPAPWRHAFGPEPPTRALGTLEQHPDSVAIAGLRTAYQGSIAYLDAQLDSLVSGLRQRGLLEHTLLIITADHGEEFFEHGRLQHGNTLYYPSIHVPLMVCPPQGAVAGGRRVAEPVSLRDLAATDVELSGDSGKAPLPGHSLVGYWRSGSLPCRSKAISFVRRTPGADQWYRGNAASLTSLVEGRFHYIRTDRGGEELFDIANDPFERQDLVAKPDMDSVLARVRTSLTHASECAAP
ncbi:MAG: sulfatase [Gemmatimonadaceae bacterium]